MTTSLKNLLDRHGILPTAQRLEVASVLLAKPQHLSAEQLLSELKDAGASVSKATVYNTLSLFCQKGLVQAVNVDPSRVFYDSTTHAHHHFFHVDSGTLTDIPAEQVRFLELPELPPGTEPAGVDVLIRVRNQADK